MTPVKISVVIPNARALPQSLLAQLCEQCEHGDEIIVVRSIPTHRWLVDDFDEQPDQPPSDSPETADALEPSRIRPCVIEADSGAAAARNVGWARATNSWVLFLDDDVGLSPLFIGAVRRFVAENAASGVIGFRVRPMSPVAPLIDLDRGPDSRTLSASGRPPLHEMWRYGVGAAIIARKDVLRAVGGFKPDLGAGRANGGAEDIEFIWHAAHHTTVAYFGGAFVWHRVPTSPRAVRAKAVAYGRALGALAGAARVPSGTRLLVGYTWFAIRSSLGPSPRHHGQRTAGVALVDAVRCVAGSILAFVTSLFRPSRTPALCARCR